MYKQTLCVTLPFSIAVIIAAALFANAGDLNPPPGDVTPTMNTLREVYDLVQQSSPCGGCTWEYSYHALSANEAVEAISGTGVVHGIWLLYGELTRHVKVVDGPINDPDNQIGTFDIYGVGIHASEFFQLDVEFTNGLHIQASETGAQVTILYRSTKLMPGRMAHEMGCDHAQHC